MNNTWHLTWLVQLSLPWTSHNHYYVPEIWARALPLKLYCHMRFNSSLTFYLWTAGTDLCPLFVNGTDNRILGGFISTFIGNQFWFGRASTLTACERNHYASCVMRSGNKESEIGICSETGQTWIGPFRSTFWPVLYSIAESIRSKCEISMLLNVYFSRVLRPTGLVTCKLNCFFDLYYVI